MEEVWGQQLVQCPASFNVIKQPSGSTLPCTIQCRDISSTAHRKTKQMSSKTYTWSVSLGVSAQLKRGDSARLGSGSSVITQAQSYCAHTTGRAMCCRLRGCKGTCEVWMQISLKLFSFVLLAQTCRSPKSSPSSFG